MVQCWLPVLPAVHGATHLRSWSLVLKLHHSQVEVVDKTCGRIPNIGKSQGNIYIWYNGVVCQQQTWYMYMRMHICSSYMDSGYWQFKSTKNPGNGQKAPTLCMTVTLANCFILVRFHNLLLKWIIVQCVQYDTDTILEYQWPVDSFICGLPWNIWQNDVIRYLLCHTL